MSYCRFGPGSDLYIYEDVAGGITIHVASRRHIIPDDMPENPMLRAKELASGEMSGETFTKMHRAYMNALARCPLEGTGLSRDGESFRGLEYEAAADLVAELRAEGYQVPDHVEEALREDAEACENV